MDQLYSQLIAILTREAEQYLALEEILGEETARLVANDAEGVIAVTRRKDTLALQIRSLEESRFLLTDKFARSLGRKADGLTVSDLCETAPPRLASALCQARDGLKAVVERASVLNDRNRQLAENSLRLIQGTMEIFQRQLRASIAPAAGYGRPPARAATSIGGLVVRQQV
ncbi:MAG: flagellar protein FlgN [Candidatus Sumerlaeota bacterium]|nr:flagellar protein FlgN [Candidatus Sumerlaeota bacterium]